MNEIQDLENKIKELRQKQEWDTIYNKYLHYKELYEGKCFTSYALTKPLLSYKKHENETWFSATLINKVFIGKQSFATFEDPDIETFEEYKQANCEVICKALGETLNVRVKSNNEFSITFGKFWSNVNNIFIYGEQYELSVEQYNSIKELLIENHHNFFNTVLKNLKFRPYFDDNIIESLKECGAKMIELTCDEIYELQSNPFRWEDRLIVNECSIKMIKKSLAEAIENDKKEKGFYSCGEYYPPSNYYKRHISTLEGILVKIKNIKND